MNLLNGISHLFGDIAEAKRMAHLFSLTDDELAARGLTRDALRKQYIAGLGAR
ncbi:hypothetical protein [Ovoidimarina sediminis]|uniref:hypothetical protein n=1 Tax=Ovoidimarina sediminis TaxID=3079856 RepID=UPI00290F9B32|nr:hypothetical protein [Rhodophyticola sp. MJ-SS7]MDU8945328.1 hypothetical protein [Rhodophyticola sp. MJ-SS7]